ncbi:glycosyltransferase family 9 protein [Salmonirosea aquatica]|uniref:Glycosyltransferase family 9 protein n=1 Tax=Salmonirosea aquatica TaxID=2654236 RepID=A0A7C9BGT3_9BACT|nr:glycosyltransferase family 9 protein [Cytophagaceae bacterium SJW1-29]
MTPRRILVIQTAFLGDAILATSVLESLHQSFPTASLDFLVRKGHESLFDGHPYLHDVLVWDKKKDRYKNLRKLLQHIRAQQYDQVITLQRFASTGFLTAFSGAKVRIGFDKNPFAFAFTHTKPHYLSQGTHEIDRNFSLIDNLVRGTLQKPRLYPVLDDYLAVKPYQSERYLCIAPASVWFTKQYPAERWAELVDGVPLSYTILILGSPADVALGEKLMALSKRKEKITNLCGKLSFLESAALMEHATMNYVNDSAPMHIASAMDAPVCAVYCSTVPAFGFGPLSDESHIVEIEEPLYCRPCGLHGYKACPEGHFRCAWEIRTERLLGVIEK